MVEKNKGPATTSASEGASSLRPHADPRPEPEAVWDDEERWAMVAENAYYRAERRGFIPGYDLEDWLAAEKEIDARDY
jgi:hypothetical protein